MTWVREGGEWHNNVHSCMRIYAHICEGLRLEVGVARTKACLAVKDRDTDYVDIVAGVLQGDT